MLQASGISLSFGAREILKSVTLNLEHRTRIALTGSNGSGKSTFMKILAGEIKADSGNIISSRGTRIAYLPQSGIVYDENSVFAEAEKAFDEFKELIERRDDIALELESNPDEKLIEEYGNLQDTIEFSDYYHRKERIEQVLHGLGFSKEDLENSCASFSGGWQMRIALAKILLQSPDILLLDEPTNYLDIEAREWLQTFLAGYFGAVLLVSHDKYFLDKTIGQVAELFQGQLKIYKGSFTKYEEVRKQELETLIAAFEKQQAEIEKHEDFIRRFRFNASKAKMVQSRVKTLEKIVPIELPESLRPMHFSFPGAPKSGKDVLALENINKSYGENHVLRGIDTLFTRGEKIALVGPNGAGKSTLMRILAGKDTKFTGSLRLGTGVQYSYFAQDQDEELDKSKNINEEIEDGAPTELFGQLRNLMGAFLFSGDDIYKSIGVLSGGEKNRVALLKMLLRPANLLLLDEPTNHLDMASKDVLLEALQKFEGTVIFVSHDHYFNAKLATSVFEINNGSYRVIPGDYDYYLWKKDQEETEAAQSGHSEQAVVEKSDNQLDREERKRLKRELNKLEKQETELMNTIDELESRHEQLQQLMSLEENYTDAGKITKLQNELQEVETKQLSVQEEWEEVAEKLEEFAAYDLN